MAYATGGGGKTVKTTGTVGGDGPITTHIDQVQAGGNVTFTSSGTTLTIASSGGGGGSGNTLDEAYDEGGSGAGRTITVDSGSVTLEGGQAEGEILVIKPNTANGDSTIPFRILQGSDYKFGIDSESSGSMVHVRGPPQSTFAVSGATKNIDPTAVDLQFSMSDPSDTNEAGYTSKSIGSGLFAGQHNAIGGPNSYTQTEGRSDSERSRFSTIIGGSENKIANQTLNDEMTGSTIVGSEASRIEYDETQRNTWNAAGWNPDDLATRYSSIMGGGNNRVKLSSHATIAGSASSNIIGSHTSGIIASDACLIDTNDNSQGPPSNNVIIGSRNSQINIDLSASNSGLEDAAKVGLMNAMIACHGALIDEEPRNCLLVGDGPKATGDEPSGDFDHSCIIVGGGKVNGGTTDTSSGATMINAIALVGKNYSTTGTNGAGKILVDHSVLTTGADFAEAFEWNDGNPDNEDRVGLFVKLSTNDSGLPNGKIEIGGENTIGPVSAVPGFLSNVTPLKWKDHFLKDDFDREIKDAEGNRTLNPDYDSEAKYKSRSARKEWAPIGMVGRLRVRASTNIGVYPSNKSGLTVNVNSDGTVSDAGAKGKYKVIQVVKQKEIWSGPEGVFRRRRQVQDHGYGVVEILVV